MTKGYLIELYIFRLFVSKVTVLLTHQILKKVVQGKLQNSFSLTS